MRKLILLLSLIPSLVLAQLSNINPDTVCFGSSGSIYEVIATPNLQYNWIVSSPGIITGGQGTNQIQVDWSGANPGLIIGAVQVQASNLIGCLSQIVTLDVFIYNITINITSLSDMCEYDNCIGLQANPVGGVWSGVGISNSDFCPTLSGPGTFNLVYTYTNSGCVFNNVTQVNVLPQPVLLPIQHN